MWAGRQKRHKIFLVYLLLVLCVLLLVGVNLPVSQSGEDGLVRAARPGLGLRVERGNNEEDVFSWLEKSAEANQLTDTQQQPLPYRNLTNLQAYLSSLQNHTSPAATTQYLPYRSLEDTHPVVQNLYRGISELSLYEEGSKWVRWAEQLMRETQIQHAENKPSGSQLKLHVMFPQFSGLLKPARTSLHQQTLPDHFYFTDVERHNAEVAGFHVDRLLGFRRAVPVVGRWVNLRQLRPVSDIRLKNSFFTSPANNTCFHGTCDYYCRTETPICGRPDLIQTSIALYLPSSRLFPRLIHTHPFKRSYSKTGSAPWETDANYCRDSVLPDPVYSVKKRRIYDIVDLAIFDFLIDNMDRHSYETFEDFRESGFILHLDQGRAFGRHDTDHISILAPLTQCCKMRWSTWLSLLRLQQFGLGDLLHDSLLPDSLSPLLAHQHYPALDRRLGKVVEEVKKCINDFTPNQVFDSFLR